VFSEYFEGSISPLSQLATLVATFGEMVSAHPAMVELPGR
jgi:hypothetical protein